MSPELARHFIRRLLIKHPLPWRVNYDWTVELLDADSRLIIQLMNQAEADELIALALGQAKYDADGEIEVARLLEEAGIE